MVGKEDINLNTDITFDTMTLEDLKAFEKARRGWDWDDFTKISAREFMSQFIRGGNYRTYESETHVAERSVRWAKALTEELKKLEQENE